MRVPPRFGLHLAFLVALLLRAALAWATPIPSEDGVVYLWMAERFAGGEWSLAMQEVFPPLWPLVIGAGIAATGAEGEGCFLVGQALAVLLGALVVYPAALLARRTLGGGELTAAWCMASAPLLARFGGECYSEALFVTLATLGLAASTGGRATTTGLWSALAYLTRPEGLAIAGAHGLWGPGPFRQRVWAGLFPAVAVLGRSLVRDAAGEAAHPLPVWTFNNQRDLDGLMDVPGSLLALPAAMVEGYGPLLIFAVLGMVVGVSRRRRRGIWGSVGISWLAGLVGILLFVVRRRFLVSWYANVTVFAVRGFGAVPRRARTPLLSLVVAYGVAVSFSGVTHRTKVAERNVGRWLAREVSAEVGIASDLTRVLWFAGRRPNPPTRFNSAQILERVAAPGVGYAVLHPRRPTYQPVRDALGERWVEVRLPEELAQAAARRGMVVLRRK